MSVYRPEGWFYPHILPTPYSHTLTPMLTHTCTHTHPFTAQPLPAQREILSQELNGVGCIVLSPSVMHQRGKYLMHYLA
jgi:hypothetical protein